MDGDPPSLCTAVSSGDSEVVNDILAVCPPEVLETPDNVRNSGCKAWLTVIVTHEAGDHDVAGAIHRFFAVLSLTTVDLGDFERHARDVAMVTS
jgi:hypothetical protein